MMAFHLKPLKKEDRPMFKHQLLNPSFFWLPFKMVLLFRFCGPNPAGRWGRF